MPPPALLPDGGTEFEIVTILSHRFENGVLRFSVKWKGDDDPTWLDESELSNAKLLVNDYCHKANLQLAKSKSRQKKEAKTQRIIKAKARKKVAAQEAQPNHQNLNLRRSSRLSAKRPCLF